MCLDIPHGTMYHILYIFVCVMYYIHVSVYMYFSCMCSSIPCKGRTSTLKPNIKMDSYKVLSRKITVS